MTHPQLIVIGVSSGGLTALQTLLPGLPGDLCVPVVVAQHRIKDGSDGLAEYLQKWCRLPISEPEDKEEIAPGRVYLAPRDYHLLIERGHFALSTQAPVTFARPSIDVLFETAADAYRADVVGVVLTGSNQDGARGLARIKALGGLTIVEDPSGAASRTMPEAALAATRVDHVLPLPEIASFIAGLCRVSEVEVR